MIKSYNILTSFNLFFNTKLLSSEAINSIVSLCLCFFIVLKSDLSNVFLQNFYFDPFFLWMKSEINGLLLEISFFKKLSHYQAIQMNKTKLFENHIFTAVSLFLTHRLLHIEQRYENQMKAKLHKWEFYEKEWNDEIGSLFLVTFNFHMLITWSTTRRFASAFPKRSRPKKFFKKI